MTVTPLSDRSLLGLPVNSFLEMKAFRDPLGDVFGFGGTLGAGARGAGADEACSLFLMLLTFAAPALATSFFAALELAVFPASVSSGAAILI